MNGWSLLRDGSVETSLPVSDVVHNSHTAVGFDQAVLSLHYVTVAFFPRPLDVASVWVIYTVLIGVARVVFLKEKITGENKTFRGRKAVALKVITSYSNL